MVNLKHFTILFMICSYIGFISCKFNTANADQLVFTHVIFRHGDRNPVSPYPKDPYKDQQTYWPEGFGQLTKLGKMQLYELGKFFRKRYRTLIGNGTDSNGFLYVQSTNYDRTVASAKSNLAGFFPISRDQQLNTKISWKRIPIHIVTEEWKKPCQRYEYAHQKFLKSSEYKALVKKFQPLFKYLENHSGLPVKTFEMAQYLFNTLDIQNQHNLSLPEWTKQVLVPGGAFEWAANFLFKIPTITNEMARLRFGFLVRDILARFSAKINSTLTPDRSIWIYSAHDATLAGILNTLKLFEIHSPPTAASILFELYRTKANEYYIQLFYKNSTDANLEPLNIPWCGQKCSLEKFRSVYKSVIPVNSFQEECQLAKSKSGQMKNAIRNEGDGSGGVARSLIAVLGLLATVLFFIIVLWMICNLKRNGRGQYNRL